MNAIRPLLDQIQEFSREYHSQLEGERTSAKPRVKDEGYATDWWLGQPEEPVRASLLPIEGIRELASPLSD